MAQGEDGFAAQEFIQDGWLQKMDHGTEGVAPLLKNSLDPGEASVIQLAVNKGVSTVCIDEAVGRRIARLSGLQVTGSLGILIKAKRNGAPVILKDVVAQMRAKGIWLSDSLVQKAYELAGEQE